MSDLIKYLLKLMPKSIAIYESLSLSDFEVRFESDLTLPIELNLLADSS